MLPPLLRDLCREGLTLSPLAFASHWLCYFWTAELHTGSGSLWKWLHAHSEIGSILATLRMIFQDISSFLAAYWLRYFHLRETSSDNFVRNSRKRKKTQQTRVSWKKCFILEKLCSTQKNSWAWSLITPVRGRTPDRGWSLSSHSFSSSGNTSFALGTGDSIPPVPPEGFSVKEPAAPPQADQHPGEAASPP